MRRLAVWAVVAAMAVASASASAQQPVADPAQGPGCLGTPLTACIAWLRASMQLDEGRIASALPRSHWTDVNGKPFGAGLVDLSGRLPGRTQTQIITLTSVNKGDLSTMVGKLESAGLLADGKKQPTLAISVPSNFFDADAKRK